MYSLFRSCSLFLAFAAIAMACNGTKRPHAPAPRVVRDTVRDPDQDKRIARLELQLLARDAQIEDLQVRLEDTRAEAVRVLATSPLV